MWFPQEIFVTIKFCYFFKYKDLWKKNYYNSPQICTKSIWAVPISWMAKNSLWQKIIKSNICKHVYNIKIIKKYNNYLRQLHNTCQIFYFIRKKKPISALPIFSGKNREFRCVLALFCVNSRFDLIWCYLWF